MACFPDVMCASLFTLALRTSDCAVALDGLGSREAQADAWFEYAAAGSPSAVSIP